jgi:hypothetical protein
MAYAVDAAEILGNPRKSCDVALMNIKLLCWVRIG